MKAVKFVFKLLVFAVILIVAAVLALPLWFGPVAKTAANAVVPGIVKTDFRLGHLSLNPYTARFELGNLNLGNPKGYMVPDAVKVGDVIFDAETASLLTDVIHIEEITIRDLYVSVVTGGKDNVLNFTQIQYDVAGGKEKYEAAQAEKKAGPSPEGPSSVQKPQSDKPAKKIIIDRLDISGLTIQLSILPIKVPSVVLTNIGRKSGGATLDEAWQQILDGIMKSAGVAGEQLKALTALSGDTMKKANEAVSQTTAAVNDASKKLSETTGQATKSVDSVLGKTTGTASGTVDATKNAVDSGAKAVDDGVKAVGDGAKKAMDSLKKLW